MTHDAGVSAAFSGTWFLFSSPSFPLCHLILFTALLLLTRSYYFNKLLSPKHLELHYRPYKGALLVALSQHAYHKDPLIYTAFKWFDYLITFLSPFPSYLSSLIQSRHQVAQAFKLEMKGMKFGHLQRSIILFLPGEKASDGYPLWQPKEEVEVGRKRACLSGMTHCRIK